MHSLHKHNDIILDFVTNHLGDNRQIFLYALVVIENLREHEYQCCDHQNHKPSAVKKLLRDYIDKYNASRDGAESVDCYFSLPTASASDIPVSYHSALRERKG